MLYATRKQRLHKHDPGVLQICQVENYTIFAEMHRILYEILPKKLRILSTCKRFSIHRHAWSMHGGDLVVTHEHVNKYRIAGNFCWCKFSRKYVCTLFSRNESVTL